MPPIPTANSHLNLWELEESSRNCFAQNKLDLLFFEFCLIWLTASAEKLFIWVQKTYHSDLQPDGSDDVYPRLV